MVLAKDGHGLTALHHAAFYRHLATVRALLAAGAALGAAGIPLVRISDDFPRSVISDDPMVA